MQKCIAVIGSLDTKGDDFAFIKKEIEKRGHRALLINTGVLGEPLIEPDVSASEVAQAGGKSLEELREKNDKSLAMKTMKKGIAIVIDRLYKQKKIDGGFSMGGSNGTIIGTSGLRALPLGVPKVMVSTMASGDTQPYVGVTDIVMIPSILDVSGVNRVSAKIYANAVGTIIGMVETEVPKIENKPIITASMFGNTTKLVNHCKDLLTPHNYEVLVFHAVGTGGRMMESLIQQGYISGVLELTPTELVDEFVGGVLSAGPERMEAATKWYIPQVIAPGCMDMANFCGIDTVPEKWKDRNLYEWNENVTLMRTTPEENEMLGKILAEKANKSIGPVAIFLPLKGVSELDSLGKPFWWPEADEALFSAIKAHLRDDIPVVELNCNINDPEFAEAVSNQLLTFLNQIRDHKGD